MDITDAAELANEIHIEGVRLRTLAHTVNAVALHQSMERLGVTSIVITGDRLGDVPISTAHISDLLDSEGNTVSLDDRDYSGVTMLVIDSDLVNVADGQAEWSMPVGIEPFTITRTDDDRGDTDFTITANKGINHKVLVSALARRNGKFSDTW